jgi:hypothetical protein
MLPRTKQRLGLALSLFPSAFLLFDVVIKLVKIGPVTEAMTRLGYPDHLSRPIGVIELVCLVAYLVPRTRRLGMLLMIGFLGGAVATHVRLDDPLLSHSLFPIYIAALLWSGLALRDPITAPFLTLRR